MKGIKKITKLITLLIVLAGVGIFQARAQVTVEVSGTVLQPLQMSGTNLSFGDNIFPGLDKQIDRTSTEAAQFDISGEPGKEVTISFTLPAEMEDGFSNTLPVNFGTSSAGHASSSTDQASAISFDPNSPVNAMLGSTTGELYLWLGGTVSPPKNQQAGNYTGDIVLDIAYSGN